MISSEQIDDASVIEFQAINRIIGDVFFLLCRREKCAKVISEIDARSILNYAEQLFPISSVGAGRGGSGGGDVVATATVLPLLMYHFIIFSININ